MITNELTYRINEAFGHVPTQEQEKAIGVFTAFMTDRHEEAVMVLRGSAGTGKTTLAAAIVRAMLSLGQKMVLMAPTGRAAKVFSLYAGTVAYTIHRRIYRQKSLEGVFELNYNNAQDTLFIVDEASMVANQGLRETMFAGGMLLDDLIRFVYNGRNCRLLLIGDRAQLPPVGEEDSPALQPDILRSYGLHVYECDLNEVLRQSAESGILWNATKIRESLELPKIRFAGFHDIKVVPGDELIETLASSYSHVGNDETLVVTRSNKRANIYNQGIRKRNIQELYGLRFADVTMTFPDYNDFELTATVLLDTLTSEAPALTREQQEQLYNGVMEDYAEIRFKSERLKKLKEDRFYNALQIKFAYAATCHKAQGGQWAHVYVDQGYMTDDMLNSDYMHWLYTAFTRATEQLYLVNWPKTQIQNE